MAEWLYEEGIGENRAILVEDGAILEAAIELPGLRAGAVVAARLTNIAGIATLGDGTEAMVAPLPAASPKARPSAPRSSARRSPSPAGRSRPRRAPPICRRATGRRLASGSAAPTPLSAIGPDRFEEAGWSELLEEAASGEIAFEGGALRMSLTPAMTLFDVDGGLPPAALAEAGAAAAARAIRRFGIGGSIGIDLPTLPRDRRQAAAAALDAILPQPFERTAVNGFGFLQIVRRRERPSLPELRPGGSGRRRGPGAAADVPGG